MKRGTCLFGHEAEIRARGLCDRHYGAIVRRGNPLPEGIVLPPPAVLVDRWVCDCPEDTPLDRIGVGHTTIDEWRECATCHRPRRADLSRALVE